MEFVLRLMHATGGQTHFGIVQNAADLTTASGSLGNTEKIMFSCETTVVSKLNTSNGTATSGTDLSDTPSGSYKEFRFVWDAVNGNVKAYINGTLKATVSTNIPSSSGNQLAIGYGTTVSGNVLMNFPRVRYKFA